MSDKYISLASFKYGLDGRRDQLSSVPGTLVSLVNGFINAGGEIEQRMSFVRDAHDYPANTFGLQDTDTGLMTFGSDVSPSGTLPTGVVYQRLTYPTVFAGFGSALLDNVIFTCNYLGKAFVIAHWTDSGAPASDRGTFMYYNGVAVGPSYFGQFWGGGATDLAINAAAEIAALPDWTAVANVDQFGVALNGSVIFATPTGVQISPVISAHTTGTGRVAVAPIDQGSAGTPNIGATATFTITGGTPGTVTAQAPLNADGSGTAVLCNAVPWNTDAATTAHDVAVAIRANSTLFNYTAAAVGAVVTVYSPPKFGAFAFNLTVITTGSVTTASGATVFNFHMSLTPQNLLVDKRINVNTGDIVLSGTVIAGYGGQSGAVTITWQESDYNGNPISPGLLVSPITGIAMSTLNGGSCGFSKLVTARVGNVKSIGNYICTAHDAGTGKTVVQLFSVTLSLTLQ